MAALRDLDHRRNARHHGEYDHESHAGDEHLDAPLALRGLERSLRRLILLIRLLILLIGRLLLIAVLILLLIVAVIRLTGVIAAVLLLLWLDSLRLHLGGVDLGGSRCFVCLSLLLVQFAFLIFFILLEVF